MKVCELPDADKPIFKLKYFGPAVLSNVELVQLLTGVSDLEVASEVLMKSGGISYLHKMTIEEFKEFAGIGESVASKIVAAMEFGRRASQISPIEATKISTPDDVYNMFYAEVLAQTQEVLSAVLLNAKLEVMTKETVSKGGVVSMTVRPCDVFRTALKRGANAIILVHNHPSGDPTPSQEDIYFTEQIKQSGDLLGIKILDHIIIGHGKFTSLRDMNHLNFGGTKIKSFAEEIVRAKNKERER